MFTGQSPILDSRCYLEGGGSAESFLASEDMPVDSIIGECDTDNNFAFISNKIIFKQKPTNQYHPNIGKLRINGNPNKDTGDITLSLRERDAPVEIKAGTKDLILAIALDKEGVSGPSSVYVNVICDRRHSIDPVSLHYTSHNQFLILISNFSKYRVL